MRGRRRTREEEEEEKKNRRRRVGKIEFVYTVGGEGCLTSWEVGIRGQCC